MNAGISVCVSVLLLLACASKISAVRGNRRGQRVTYTMSIDDPIIVHAADNNPVKVASTNTWFSLFRFTAAAGTTIFFRFTDVSFTSNTKWATSSYIITGSGSDPTEDSSQTARISPTSSQTPSNTHAYTTPNNLAYVLVSHPKGEKVEFSLHVSAIECPTGKSPCLGSPHCISEQDRCNNHVDCLMSQEDEITCQGEGEATLDHAQDNAELPACFPCVSDDFGCVEPQWVCDGAADCNDGADEQNCPCDGFTCSDNKCIPYGFKCDGVIDCSNDEANCPA
ncbi:uncharacterized protein [Diadema antillarum]|uniref:uncharacterized protein n=1 Tax=Diadema antillarum TaxID=105358 RepID=UPI003A83D4C4